jgi:hypothetical protein
MWQMLRSEGTPVPVAAAPFINIATSWQAPDMFLEAILRIWVLIYQGNQQMGHSRYGLATANHQSVVPRAPYQPELLPEAGVDV